MIWPRPKLRVVLLNLLLALVLALTIVGSARASAHDYRYLMPVVRYSCYTNVDWGTVCP